MLEARNIVLSYGSREVLRDVSLKLASGKITVLMGPNGAGKTTLLKTLNATLSPVSGSVIVDGCDISELSRREAAKKIAVVAQENETRFPVSVLELVLGGRYAYGKSFGWESADDRRIAMECLRLCDLDGYENRLLNELSGGERQRVVLARAIASQAGILLLDEPTANLDIAHQAMMIRLVRERCSGCGASALVITHDLNLAAEFADDLIFMKAGRIVAEGAVREVMTPENIKTVFGVGALVDESPVGDARRVTLIFD
jgi:iron complex transport system ATP-binding protein